jgi:hypothetical protein
MTTFRTLPVGDRRRLRDMAFLLYRLGVIVGDDGIINVFSEIYRMTVEQ